MIQIKDNLLFWAEESTSHLMFTCSFATFFWNVACGVLGNPKTPKSFFDLSKTWLLAYTGRTIDVVSIGSAALLFTVCKQGMFSTCASSKAKKYDSYVVCIPRPQTCGHNWLYYTEFS